MEYTWLKKANSFEQKRKWDMKKNFPRDALKFCPPKGFNAHKLHFMFKLI